MQGTGKVFHYYGSMDMRLCKELPVEPFSVKEKPHSINQDLCIRACIYTKCKFNAILVQ